MHIKIKYLNEKGSVRVENSVDIREVLIREHILEKEKKRIAIGFTNDYSSVLI